MQQARLGGTRAAASTKPATARMGLGLYTPALPCPAACTGVQTNKHHDLARSVAHARYCGLSLIVVDACIQHLHFFYMFASTWAIQLFLCLALVAWSHGQQTPKQTITSIDERFLEKRKLSAQPWQWQEATQHQHGNGTV